MWKKVADGSVETVQTNYSDIPTLPHGTKVMFELETAYGFAYLADIWGDEWVLNKFAMNGVTLTHTESIDATHVRCEGVVNSPGVGVILGLILVVISIVGIAYIIHRVQIWVDAGVIPSIEDVFSTKNLAAVAVVGIVGTMAVLALKEVLRR